MASPSHAFIKINQQPKTKKWQQLESGEPETEKRGNCAKPTSTLRAVTLVPIIAYLRIQHEASIHTACLF